LESTAQYWKPVWAALEGEFTLLLAQARSNAAPHGRKSDYADATRLMKRLWADDLRLSFVPEAEQRSWRLLTRTRVQHTREITRLRNRIEGLLEECRIKISGLLSDLLGASGRRMLRALIASKTTDPQQLAGLADKRLRAAPEELEQALNGQVGPVHRLLLGQLLDEIELLEDRMAKLDVLNQCAWAAVRSKDTYWQHLFRRLTPRLGVNKALWAVAHRILRVIWLVLHEGVEYRERGPCAPDPERLRRRIERMLYELRKRGVHFQLTAVAPST
jgi:hypothetical protein